MTQHSYLWMLALSGCSTLYFCVNMYGIEVLKAQSEFEPATAVEKPLRPTTQQSIPLPAATIT